MKLMSRGFTLAEVLITLGIVGVVAAITMPVLVQKYREKVIITKCKKDYAIIMQTLQMAQADFGTPNDNSSLFLAGNGDANNLMKLFGKYISGAQVCLSTSNDKICKNRKHFIALKPWDDIRETYYSGIILPDGGTIYVYYSSEKCVPTEVSGNSLDANGQIIYNEDGTPKMWTDIRNSCGNIVFDINGLKPPNKYGYDAFKLGVWSDKVDKPYWDVYGTSDLFDILQGGKPLYK